MVKVNGEMMDIAGKTVREILLMQGYEISRIAVEKNGDIVPKAEYETTILCDDDCIEIVSFVGGG